MINYNSDMCVFMHVLHATHLGHRNQKSLDTPLMVGWQLKVTQMNTSTYLSTQISSQLDCGGRTVKEQSAERKSIWNNKGEGHKNRILKSERCMSSSSLVEMIPLFENGSQHDSLQSCNSTDTLTHSSIYPIPNPQSFSPVMWTSIPHSHTHAVHPCSPTV